MSRARTLAAVALCAVAGAVLAAVLVGRGDERLYTAHFTNARGLLPDTDVRVGGAVAGRVHAVKLAKDGTALVRFTVDEDRARPRADAAAAIRPVDLLGDNYLALSPGHATAPLRGAIPADRTSNAPRLDELLSTFRAPVRDALQSLLVEGGLALDRRGPDLAASAVRLRPALAAADRVADELDAQNRVLGRAVSSADRAATQLAAGSADVRPLLRGLAQTVRATASHTGDLDTALAGMPATLAQLHRTADRLAGTATAATPLARDLRDTAPALAEAVSGLAPLLGRVRTAATDLRPAVRSATALLAKGAPTFAALDAGIERTRATAPQTAQLVDALVPAAPQIAQGFLVDFPDQAQEPGAQPGDPFADPKRAYWRGAAVFSCEAFGIPVKPGCLAEALKSFAPSRREGKQAATGAARPAATGDAPAAGSAPSTGAGLVQGLTDPLRRLAQPLLDRLRPSTGGAGAAGAGRGDADPSAPMSGLLDLLLGR